MRQLRFEHVLVLSVSDLQPTSETTLDHTLAAAHVKVQSPKSTRRD
jgi:hypothetical protein